MSLAEPPPPSPEEGDEPPDQRVFRETSEKLEVVGRKLGLYLMEAHGRRQPLDEARPGIEALVRPILVGRFTLGDIAFSDKVQHPEKYTDKVVVAEMEHHALKSEVEPFLDRYRKTGKIFDDEED